ncbi:MAG TPA: uracil-DNA glycosylase [Planctomycetota bacterium]|nr:uracil-DNA glycosylase [Planctomycetota bacterium]
MHESADRYLRSMQAAGVRAVPLPGARTGPEGAAAAPVAPATSEPQGARAQPGKATSGTGRPAASAPAPAPAPGVPASRAPLAGAPIASTQAGDRLAAQAVGLASAGGGGGAAVARPQPAPEAEALLAEVAAEVAVCRACRLCETRHLTVPGEGSARARVVFVGEGPGADEDRTGRPFVGRAGQLLEDILIKGMKLSREQVYICNVVKCRPPANRVPEPDEAAACAGYLDRQLLAIAPAVICTLGATAARRLLDTELSMGALRGRTHDWRGIPVITTYHPAYLLRNPAAKVPTWQDIQRVMELMRTP